MKTKQLIKFYKILKIAMPICILLGVLSFIAVIGFIGSFDYYDEIHQIMPKDEETKCRIGTWVSVGLFGLFSGISSAIERLQINVRHELRRRKALKKKIRERKFAAIKNATNLERQFMPMTISK